MAIKKGYYYTLVLGHVLTALLKIHLSVVIDLRWPYLSTYERHHWSANQLCHSCKGAKMELGDFHKPGVMVLNHEYMYDMYWGPLYGLHVVARMLQAS